MYNFLAVRLYCKRSIKLKNKINMYIVTMITYYINISIQHFKIKKNVL